MARDLDAARAELRRHRVAPFHPWRLSRPTAALIREADNDLNNGWVREADRAVVELAAPYAWEAEDAPAIAVTEMHGWLMTDALLEAHGATGSWGYLETVIELAEDWSTHAEQTRRAWRTAAAARRTHRLAYIAHAAAVADSVDMDQWRSLVRLAERHVARLAATDADGVELALAVAARRSLSLRLGNALEVEVTTAAELVAALGGAVDRDGITASRNPADHFTLTAVVAAADADDPHNDYGPIRRPIEDGLAWLISTDGTPANLGTIALEPINGLWRGGDLAVKELAEPLVSQLLRHAVSLGAAGHPPTSDTRILDGAGLLVAKPVWPDDRSMTGSFVVMDKATGDVVWHDKGRPLIVAVGTDLDAIEGVDRPRFRKARAWLASPTAHNRLTLDPDPEETAAASRIGVLNGTTFFDATRDADDLTVRRAIVVNPGRWLLVADWATDAADVIRRGEQRFLLGPGLDALTEVDRYLITADGRPVMWAGSVGGDSELGTPRRGGVEGADGGWWAPRPGRIASATQIGWTAEGSHLLIATVFSFDGPPIGQDAGAWSFAFSVGDRTTHISLSELGLIDMQESTS